MNTLENVTEGALGPARLLCTPKFNSIQWTGFTF